MRVSFAGAAVVKIKKVGYTRPVGLECTPEGRDVVRAARRIYAADTW